jgi:hypothetical protein
MAREDGRIYLSFNFNRGLINEVKNMAGVKWHGFDVMPMKVWSFPITSRNLFQLDYLLGKNPYSSYDLDLKTIKFDRPLFQHQVEMAQHILTRHYCMIAGEMGVGKSLAAIVAMENSETQDWWWIASKSAIKSVELEIDKWKSGIRPRLLTYDELKKVVKNWKNGNPAPRGIIFDESARLKNPNTQRSEAAMVVAEAIRLEYNNDGYVVCMTGTPAPKSPVDWWFQCEVSRPGFIVEGNLAKFKKRLCLIEERDGLYGVYPHLITWWDNEDKCAICGQFKDDLKHDLLSTDFHTFVKSKNEVQLLYTRLRGLVLVKFKRDCLDLPDKRYVIRKINPSPTILRVAQTIAENASTTIKALTLLRELSDGFQYTDTKIGEEVCECCNGLKIITVPETEPCPHCSGTGMQVKYDRTATYVESPKDEVLGDILEEHEEVGRLVIYAGFTGTIDHICEFVKSKGWDYIRLDGKGWSYCDKDGNISSEVDEPLKAMDLSHPEYQVLREKYEFLCVIGHPASGGEGLTFTASPSIVYYSNDFNGMFRMQSEDRIHRAGMDKNKGATIIDIFHLPTDEYVLNNLKLKKDLQSLSLGELRKCLL